MKRAARGGPTPTSPPCIRVAPPSRPCSPSPQTAGMVGCARAARGSPRPPTHTHPPPSAQPTPHTSLRHPRRRPARAAPYIVSVPHQQPLRKKTRPHCRLVPAVAAVMVAVAVAAVEGVGRPQHPLWPHWGWRRGRRQGHRRREGAVPCGVPPSVGHPHWRQQQQQRRWKTKGWLWRGASAPERRPPRPARRPAAFSAGWCWWCQERHGGPPTRAPPGAAAPTRPRRWWPPAAPPPAKRTPWQRPARGQGRGGARRQASLLLVKPPVPRQGKAGRWTAPRPHRRRER